MLGGREYATIRALAMAEIVDLDGIKLRKAEGRIQSGDLYVAERNTGPKLLTAKEVVMSECGCCINYVIPTTTDYCFDGGECVRVEEA